MLAVSFARTAEAFADRSKTETRRFWKFKHVLKFKPGALFVGLTKDRRAGGKPIHIARVVSVNYEALGAISLDSFRREGGTRYWRNRKDYIAAMGGSPARNVWVLRFDHVPDVTRLRAKKPLVALPKKKPPGR